MLFLVLGFLCFETKFHSVAQAGQKLTVAQAGQELTVTQADQELTVAQAGPGLKSALIFPVMSHLAWHFMSHSASCLCFQIQLRTSPKSKVC